MKKKTVLRLLVVFFIVIFIGAIKVSSTLPNFIKDNSKFKVIYNTKPFNLTFETDKYIFYINKKSIDNIKNYMNNFLNGVFSNIKNKSDGFKNRVILSTEETKETLVNISDRLKEKTKDILRKSN
ncbi:hypothetical protein [Clostridium rectalis]|uniref:hypothetical protein n=1 Tax=Clostridium rectalis TaxID=2040295 RepID=UPI000F634619|nr:hypothetical protein [Clostridium rectalis]